MAYLKRIAALKPAALPISPRAVMDQVISGEYTIGMQIYNHHAAISAAVGAPVDWVKLEPMIGLFSLMGVLEGCAASERRAAVRGMGHVGRGPEGARGQRLPAVRPQLSLLASPGLRPDGERVWRVNYISPLMARDELPKWTAIYQEIFR